ncbi:hypothetical protein VOLCADRAFT_92066 [Volvox carteri f. nagariensis]|uniref:Uncharacterized protein n=1 Tax=Volvox carteri f. nagariensis TaxID=3068 RepID=D8TZ10_VOLCA|nr:uncharacterized protein VOLCADRAFT_92066 [Volvox carteri f. nagariensis]EFJ47315.1 hypothetical protein VOLCADRAFT_92066 [Volvox carteri f. nagariensis]|eukprot:XP_002951504.1 hypothetical protein VOLCADRAFT_92066 [Volvox carteri f. nagariensis]
MSHQHAQSSFFGLALRQLGCRQLQLTSRLVTSRGDPSILSWKRLRPFCSLVLCGEDICSLLKVNCDRCLCMPGQTVGSFTPEGVSAAAGYNRYQKDPEVVRDSEPVTEAEVDALDGFGCGASVGGGHRDGRRLLAGTGSEHKSGAMIGKVVTGCVQQNVRGAFVVPHVHRGVIEFGILDTHGNGLLYTEQAVAMRVKDAKFDHTMVDTWYYEGAPYILLDTTCAEAGVFHNNEVEACGLLTDEREPPDDGTRPYRQLQYLPATCATKRDHLSVPPKGIKRAMLFILLTCFKSLNDIHLLCPLYTTPTEHRSVITAFHCTTKLTDDLAAELHLLDATAADTHRRYRNKFRWAQQLEARRAPSTGT